MMEFSMFLKKIKICIFWTKENQFGGIHQLNTAPCGCMYGRKSLFPQPHDGGGKTAVVT